jgi:hypothetical protein
MNRATNERLPNGTRVRFNIGNRSAEGEAIIRDAEYDDGWLYLIDVTSGDQGDEHRSQDGGLRAWDFEVGPL